MCVVKSNCLVICDHNRPVSIYSLHSRGGHRSGKTVDVIVGYQNAKSGQKYILETNRIIQIHDLDNHLLSPMQCHLNGGYISKVPKFLAESPSVSAHAIELVTP